MGDVISGIGDAVTKAMDAAGKIADNIMSYHSSNNPGSRLANSALNTLQHYTKGSAGEYMIAKARDVAASKPPIGAAGLLGPGTEFVKVTIPGIRSFNIDVTGARDSNTGRAMWSHLRDLSKGSSLTIAESFVSKEGNPEIVLKDTTPSEFDAFLKGKIENEGSGGVPPMTQVLYNLVGGDYDTFTEEAKAKAKSKEPPSTGEVLKKIREHQLSEGKPTRIQLREKSTENGTKPTSTEDDTKSTSTEDDTKSKEPPSTSELLGKVRERQLREGKPTRIQVRKKASSYAEGGAVKANRFKQGFIKLWGKLPKESRESQAYRDWYLKVKKSGDYEGGFEWLVKQGRYESLPEAADYLEWVRGYSGVRPEQLKQRNKSVKATDKTIRSTPNYSMNKQPFPDTKMPKDMLKYGNKDFNTWDLKFDPAVRKLDTPIQRGGVFIASSGGLIGHPDGVKKDNLLKGIEFASRLR